MKFNLHRIVVRTGLLACSATAVFLMGCETDGSSQHRGYASRSTVHVQGAVVFEDDYDYYPAYETYYSRNRREYVYRDGGRWVRRAEPRGVTVELLFAAPSVRLDFRDSPEKHHSTVVRSYPKNWQRPDQNRDDRDERKENKQDKRKKDKRNDDR